MQGSGGMAAEIGCSQAGQRFFFRQFGGRWNSFVQKGIGVLPSMAFSAAHNSFDFGTRHKAGHVVVVCKQSRTFKMFRNLLFRQASLPAEDIPKYGMASVILLFRDFQTMSFCIRIIGGFDALCREFQHPTNVFCCYQVPCGTHYVGSQYFPLMQGFFHGLNSR